MVILTLTQTSIYSLLSNLDSGDCQGSERAQYPYYQS